MSDKARRNGNGRKPSPKKPAGPSLRDQAKKLVRNVYSAPEFLARKIPPRTWLVEGCIPHPSLGLLYAWRGSGKTYTALQLGLDLAAGKDFMVYSVPKRRTVLFVDGEMPVADLKERIGHLSDNQPPDRLYLISSEDLATEHINLNLATEDGRGLVNTVLIRMEERGARPDLIIFDNWASLVRGLNENDNSEIDSIKEWLMRLRHGGISVLLIHHAGKAGQQRGASAREDHPDYSIVLEEKPADQGDRATYILWEWDKIRGAKPEPRKFKMVLGEDESGHLHLRPSDDAARGEPPRWLEFLHWWATHGRPRDREAAEGAGISEAMVQKNMRTARRQGLLIGSQGKAGARRLTEKGLERLGQFWPGYWPENDANRKLLDPSKDL